MRKKLPFINKLKIPFHKNIGSIFKMPVFPRKAMIGKHGEIKANDKIEDNEYTVWEKDIEEYENY
jgi:hypothetical protein